MKEEIIAKVMHIGLWIYGYCTDFMINAANLTNTSYYEMNALILCITWPAVTLFLITWFFTLK